jgi:hypothetical protein
MADSQFRLIGRGIGALAAVSLLAGVSLDAAAAGNKGKIFLETGKTLASFNFTYVGDGGPVVQQFAYIKGCTIGLDPADPDNLVTLSALRDGNAGTLGFMATSIGVYDGPQGTACGRVSGAKSEALQFGLGPDIPSGANAFDTLELDVEVKGAVVLQLDVTFDAGTVTHYLTAGGGVVPSGAPAGDIFPCSAASDSGPDAGPSDNCRWIVEELGRSFTIKPLVGEFSLEGGGDFADVLLNRTAIFLTQADGIFDCGETETSADATMSCSITRLDPGGTAACVPVPFVFRTGGGSCELTVDPDGQQIVANLFVSYRPEPSTTASLSSTTWPAAPLSKVSFADAPNTSFSIPACRGVTIDNGFAPGPAPIPETKPDWISGNSSIDFACAFQRTETFQTGANGLETWIDEGIQFWGDISFSRF